MSVTKFRRAAAVLLAASLMSAAVGVFCTGAAAGEPKDKKTDQKKLQGAWSVVSIETGGGKKTDADEEVKTAKVVFKDDKITLTMGEKTEEVTFKLDETKTPRQIDMTETKDGKEEVHLGIYRLDGDTFTLCKSHPPQERPTEFATKEGAKWPMIVVLKRKPQPEKKEQKEGKVGPAAKDPDTKTEEEKLLGTWAIVSEEKGGAKEPAEKIKALKVIFTAGGKFTVKYKNGEEQAGTYKVDTAKKVKHITFDDVKTHPGIYKLSGDELTVCLGPAGSDERPSEFVSKAGTEVQLVVLKRQKE